MDRRIDHDLARVSELVYLPREDLDWEVRRHGWGLVNLFEHAGSEAALIDLGTAYALAFRGTQVASGFSLVDLAANLGRPTLWAGPGFAHRGYVQHLERVRFQARRFAEQAAGELPLYVTGHSLGGALATLYAAWVGADDTWGHNLEALVTFGAPKALSRNGAAAIDCHVRRYVIPMDFAPRWPPSLILRHPAPAIRLDAPSWWPGPISRHGVGQYVRALAPLNSIDKE